MDASHGPPLTLWKNVSIPLIPVLVSVENLTTDPIHQAHYQRDSPEYLRLLAGLRHGEVILVEVLWTHGSLGRRGRPPPCHRHCTKTTNRLEETLWTSTNHLAENNCCSSSELWGSIRHGGNQEIGIRDNKSSAR